MFYDAIIKFHGIKVTGVLNVPNILKGTTVMVLYDFQSSFNAMKTYSPRIRSVVF